MIGVFGTPLLLLLFHVQIDEAAEPGDCRTAGCVLNVKDDSYVPADPYRVSDIITGSSCAPFTKYLNVYGLLLAGGTDSQVVSDNGMKWIAHAMVELFPADASDQAGQTKILLEMYRYKATNPVFFGKFVDKQAPAKDHVSMCDTITLGSDENNMNGQILEVYEHLHHIIFDVGLSKAYPDKWGISTNSDIYKAMQEAICKKVFSVKDYESNGADGRLRVQLQEYQYWVMSTIQGVHAKYFEGTSAPEWTLTTAAQVQAQLPLTWALHQDTTAKWLGSVSTATLTEIGKLAKGGTPSAATWPIVQAGRANSGTVGGGPEPVTPCKKPAFATGITACPVCADGVPCVDSLTGALAGVPGVCSNSSGTSTGTTTGTSTGTTTAAKPKADDSPGHRASPTAMGAAMIAALATVLVPLL